MISLILASYLASQTWTWLKVADPDVALYRIYWGASGIAWCSQNRVEIPATQCDATVCGQDGICCGDIPEPPYKFIIVTAVDSSGNESGTDHGGIVSCP
jgi:hypothetical protein